MATKATMSTVLATFMALCASPAFTQEAGPGDVAVPIYTGGGGGSGGGAAGVSLIDCTITEIAGTIVLDCPLSLGGLGISNLASASAPTDAVNLSDLAGLSGGGAGDNLGNHTATQTLDMGAQDITNAKLVFADQYFYNSDRTMKNNIDAAEGLDLLRQISPVRWTWREGGGVSRGVIAQEIAQILPEMVHTDPGTGLMRVDYVQLIAPLIQAVKELDARVTQLEAERENRHAPHE